MTPRVPARGDARALFDPIRYTSSLAPAAPVLPAPSQGAGLRGCETLHERSDFRHRRQHHPPRAGAVVERVCVADRARRAGARSRRPRGARPGGSQSRPASLLHRQGRSGAAGRILRGRETVREPGEQRGVRPLDRTASRPFERLELAAAGAQLFLALCRNIADFAAVPGVPSDAGGRRLEGRRQGAALRLGGSRRGGSMPANANGRSARTRKLVTRRGAELQVSELGLAARRSATSIGR